MARKTNKQENAGKSNAPTKYVRAGDGATYSLADLVQYKSPRGWVLATRDANQFVDRHEAPIEGVEVVKSA